MQLGNFLIACHFAKNLSSAPGDKHDSGIDLDPIRIFTSIIPLKSAEDSEAFELCQTDGTSSELFKAATAYISSSSDSFLGAAMRVFVQAARIEANHSVIRKCCSSEYLTSLLATREDPEIRKSVASLLFLLSFHRPAYLNEHVVGIIMILTSKSLQIDCAKVLLCTVANAMANEEGLKALLDYSSPEIFNTDPIERMLGFFYRVKEKISADLFRFFTNMFIVSSERRISNVETKFIQTVFGPGNRILLGLDLQGGFYLFEALGRLLLDEGNREFFVVQTRGISALVNCVDQTLLITASIAPRIGLLLENISSDAHLHSAFIEQEGLELVRLLYWKSSRDDVVCLCVARTIENLLSHPARVFQNCSRYLSDIRRIVQDACRNNTHLEVLTHSLDSWIRLLEFGIHWDGGALTLSSMFSSKCSQVRIKALKILSRLLEDEKNRLEFLEITENNLEGSDKFLLSLSQCLTEESFIVRQYASEGLASLSLIQDSNGVQIIEKNGIFKTLYDVYGQMGNNCDAKIRLMLAKLFMCGSQDLKRRCFKELRLNTAGSAIEIVAGGLEKDLTCQEAFLELSSDPGFVGNVSGFFPFIFDLIIRYENISVIKIFCGFVKNFTNQRVQSALSKYDVISLCFRLFSSQNTAIAECGVKAIRDLIHSKQTMFLEEMRAPSRIFAIVSCLAPEKKNLVDHAISILHALVLSDKSSDKSIFLDHIGLEIRSLVECLIEKSDFQFLSLIVGNVRVRRILFAKPCFCECLISHISENKFLLFSAIEKPKQKTDISANVVASLEILSNVSFEIFESSSLFSYSKITQFLQNEIAQYILNDLVLDEIGKLRPKQDGSTQVPSQLFISSLKILRESIRFIPANLSDVSMNQIRTRCFKFWKVAEESKRAFSRTPSPITREVLETLAIFQSKLPGCLERIADKNRLIYSLGTL